MDTKTTITAVLAGAIIGVGGTLGTAELTKEEPIIEGEEQAIVEEVPAIQPIIWVDDSCGENSLKLQIGTNFMCTNNEVYAELKGAVVEDLKKEKHTLQKDDGTACEEESEECKKVHYILELENRELFGAFLIKEMLKEGEVKALSEEPETAKAEAIEILEGKKLEIIK
jgi:hypothetical protein